MGRSTIVNATSTKSGLNLSTDQCGISSAKSLDSKIGSMTTFTWADQKTLAIAFEKGQIYYFSLIDRLLSGPTLTGNSQIGSLLFDEATRVLWSGSKTGELLKSRRGDQNAQKVFSFGEPIARLGEVGTDRIVVIGKRSLFVFSKTLAKVLWEKNFDRSIDAYSFGPTQITVVSGTLHRFELETGTKDYLFPPKGIKPANISVIATQGPEKTVVGNYQGRIQIGTLGKVAESVYSTGAPISGLSWAGDDKVVSGSLDGNIQSNAVDGSVLWKEKLTGSIETINYDGESWIFATSILGETLLIDTKKVERIPILGRIPTTPADTVQWSADRQIVAFSTRAAPKNPSAITWVTRSKPCDFVKVRQEFLLPP